jgi:DeoR/GlpR family transcriptional regulator of sugar metabolism
MKLNERQAKIINILEKNDSLSPSDIHILIGEDLYSRPTINRDLVKLLDNNIIKQYYFMGLQLPKEQVLQDKGYLIVI